MIKCLIYYLPLLAL
jgi:hypothetical protein